MNTTLPQKSSSMSSVLALLLFVVAFMAAVFYLKPLWDEVGSLDVQRNSKITQKTNLEKKITDLKSLQNDLEKSSEVSKETTLAAIPEKLNQHEIIKELHNIAKSNDIIIGGVNFNIPNSSADGQIAKAVITANLTGSQSSLIGFLKGIETSSRKMVVKTISVQMSETDLGSARANFNLTIETFYQGSF